MSGETEFASTIIAYLLFFIGSFGALGLIGRTKRRPLILWTFALMALGFLMLSQVHLGSKLMLWAALAIYSLPYGIQSVLDYVYPSELFPTSIRATALGILGSTSRVGSMISSLLFPIAFISYGQQAMCFAGAFVLAVGFAVSYFTRRRHTVRNKAPYRRPLYTLSKFKYPLRTEDSMIPDGRLASAVHS